MFSEVDAQPPFSRAANFGFRLVKYITAPAAALMGPVDYPHRDFATETPVSDAAFKIIRRLYAYDKGPLHAATDLVDDSHERWREEIVSFDAGYGGERMTAMLFLPRHARAPYETVVFFPGSTVINERSSRKWAPPWDGATIASGRALLVPVYKGTFERHDALDTDYPAQTNFYREHVIDWYRDLARAIDYVETRPDLDASRIAYLGFSWGARLGPIFLALEPRIKAAALISGGLKFAMTFPEADPFNFASRVTVPVLMVNGKYDYFFPVATSQQPLFALMRTDPKDKRHVVLESSGHALPTFVVMKEVLAWLDRYLKPVSGTS
jgi:cephalosporin-C deacetylase-like acetyl esterase